MKVLKNIILTACLTFGALGIGLVVDYMTKTIHMRNQVVQVLDVNNDRKLSESETKRFYDENGIAPYSGVTLNNAPRKELEKFLSNYEWKPVRKE